MVEPGFTMVMRNDVRLNWHQRLNAFVYGDLRIEIHSPCPDVDDESYCDRQSEIFSATLKLGDPILTWTDFPGTAARMRRFLSRFQNPEAGGYAVVEDDAALQDSEDRELVREG